MELISGTCTGCCSAALLCTRILMMMHTSPDPHTRNTNPQINHHSPNEATVVTEREKNVFHILPYILRQKCLGKQ